VIHTRIGPAPVTISAITLSIQGEEGRYQSAFSHPVIDFDWQQIAFKTMNSFTRFPKSLSSRRFLPGHANAPRSGEGTPLPGVDPMERRARRRPWTNFRAEQRASFGLRDHLGVAGAALALALMLSVALAPQPNVLDTSDQAVSATMVEVTSDMPAPEATAIIPS
jgi:hypothetical protein